MVRLLATDARDTGFHALELQDAILLSTYNRCIYAYSKLEVWYVGGKVVGVSVGVYNVLVMYSVLYGVGYLGVHQDRNIGTISKRKRE